jgi:hypothetical protein
MELHRYWIEFSDAPSGSPLGVGVTAEDRDAALALVREWYVAWGTPRQRCPTAPTVVGDIDVSRLGHLPRGLVGVPANRGIWYPCANLDRQTNPRLMERQIRTLLVLRTPEATSEVQ